MSPKKEPKTPSQVTSAPSLGLDSMDWPEILSKLSELATSEVARQDLIATQPLSGAEEATSSFKKIASMQKLLRAGRRPYMESLDLFFSWYQRLERQAVLKPIELNDVRSFCLEVLALTEILQETQDDWLKQLLDDLMSGQEPLSAIDQILTSEGQIRTDASEHLYKLTREKKIQVKQVQGVLDRLVKAHEMEPVLQDRYVTNREGRWVLPVKSGMRHSFEGIIHASSHSRQTVFMEPTEIIPINNRLRQIEVEIEEEVERLLKELSQYLSSLIQDFKCSYEILKEGDIRLAQGQLSNQLNAAPPVFENCVIELSDLRHPLLVLNNEPVVSNSLSLHQNQHILILSGPNAGGKTVLLKSLGLAAQMARCGLPICAEAESRLPFFDHLHVAVGDSQSVDENLSTFAAHLRILNQATEAQGTSELVLIDEICGSTDPEEGSALARSFIHKYAENNVFGLITSHLGALKMGWSRESGVINGSLEYDPEKGPTYQFLMGVPGQSLALQTARRVGVNSQILDRALEFLSPNKREQEKNLEQTEALKKEIEQVRSLLKEQLAEAKTKKEEYKRLMDEFYREKEKRLDQVVRQADLKVQEMIQSANVDKTFRRHEELEKIKKELPEMIKGAPPRSQQIVSEEDFAKNFPPGSRVFVPSIGRDGIVQGRPSSKGEVPILSASMRLQVQWKELKPPEKNLNPTQDVLRRSGSYQITPASENKELDLRGHSIDEAIGQLEVALDEAAAKEQNRLKIIHGHGTDALKRAVRSHLSRSTYIQQWRAGQPSEGGDGITWAELR